jgi:hypothetical protein
VNLLLGLTGDQRQRIPSPPPSDPGYVPENLPPPVPTSLTDYATMGLRPRSLNLIDERQAHPPPPLVHSGLSEILKRLPRQTTGQPQPLLLQLLNAMQGGQ